MSTEVRSTSEQTFKALEQEALTNSNVLGFFLGGSRGKGFEHTHSDYDIIFIVKDDALATFKKAHPFRYAPSIECIVYGLTEFETYAQPDSPFAWDRYSFTHVKVRLDKTGTIQALVDDKGSLPPRSHEYWAATLDGYINSVYRSLKSYRKGDMLAARLHANSSLGPLLELIFGLENRLAPYFDYLRLELTHYPLTSFSLHGKDLLAKLEEVSETASVRAQQDLFGRLEPLCLKQGLGETYESWGANYKWLKTYAASKSG